MDRMLFILVGLLFGLVLCCYLGNWNYYEGMENGDTSTYYGPNGTTAVVNTSSKTVVVTKRDGTTDTYDVSSDDPNVYLGPNGIRADIASDTDIVTVTDANGKTITFNPQSGDGAGATVNGNNRVSDNSRTGTNGNNNRTGTNGNNNRTGTNGSNNRVSGNRNTTTTSTSSTSTNYDNYDHYSGKSYPNIFYGPDGITARIVKTSTTDTIVVTNSNGTTETYYIDENDPETEVYYGPNDGSIKIITDTDGKTAIEVTTPDGSTVVYAQNNKYGNYDTVNDPGVNDYGVNQGGPYDAGKYDPGRNEPGRNDPGVNDYGVNQGGPYDAGKYDPGRNEPGRNDPGINDPGLNQPGRDYYSSLPPGVPRSQIPPGEEDLYILKSQVVPPVCPACPAPICPAMDESKCPACPACARCPEPQFECKKTFTAAAFNPEYAPVPVLSDFSGFGM